MGRKHSFLAAAAAIALTMSGVATLSVGTAQAAPRATLRGSALSWTRSAHATGLASATHKVTVRVYLKARDQAALDAAVSAVSTPGSSQYRHFISASQYAAQYAPTAAQAASVEQWLRSNGMHVMKVAANNRYVTASGLPANANKAFGTTLRTYRHADTTVIAPDIDASVPAALAGTVLGVTGLDNAPHYMATKVQGSPPPPTAFVPATPCSQYYGQLTATTGPDGTAIPNFAGSSRAWANCGYLPQQLNAAYGGPANQLDGAGVTVAITLWYASPTQPADENHFDRDHGFPQLAPGQYTVVPPDKPYHFPNACGSAEDEQSIDITSVHNVAPAANILYYAGASCGNNDMLDTLAKVVDENKASIVNSSWGGILSTETTGDELANEQVFKQGALQGQQFLFSSGDNGDWVSTLGRTDFDYPGSDPFVTSVGGTTLNIDNNGNTVWQAGWGYNKLVLQNGKWVTTGFGGGAGGGFAPDWARPGYQHGVVRNPAAGRAYPDVAALADTVTGIRVGFNQVYPNGQQHYSESRYGGTSVSSPLFAGEQALAEQALGGRIGFANPLIYSLARAGSDAFDDVTGAHDSEALVRADFVNSINAKAGYIYSVRTIDDDSSLHTTTGWDDTTGVGTPNANYAPAMAAAAAAG